MIGSENLNLTLLEARERHCLAKSEINLEKRHTALERRHEGTRGLLSNVITLLQSLLGLNALQVIDDR